LKKCLTGACSIGILIFICTTAANSQQFIDKPTLGIEIKPVVPSNLFATNSDTVSWKHAVIGQSSAKNYLFTITPELSFSAGAVIRAAINRQWSVESGIYYTARTYGTSAKDSTGKVIKDNFRFDNYEIPLLGLLYIRLSKNVYINNAFGLCLDFLPDDIQTPGNSFYYVRVNKLYWVLPALMANVGAEYRTQNNGYFYIGALYHRELTELGEAGFFFTNNEGPEGVGTPLNGHYFALDFKYFFPTKRTPVIDNGY